MNHRDTVTLSLSTQINALHKQAAELGADDVVITQAQGLMFGSGQGVNAAEKAIRWAR